MVSLTDYLKEAQYKTPQQRADELKQIFIEELGWNKWRGPEYKPFSKGPLRFKLIPVAQRNNVDILYAYDLNAVFTIGDITDNVDHGAFVVIMYNGNGVHVVGAQTPGRFNGACIGKEKFPEFLEALKFGVEEETTSPDVFDKIIAATKI